MEHYINRENILSTRSYWQIRMSPEIRTVIAFFSDSWRRQRPRMPPRRCDRPLLRRHSAVDVGWSIPPRYLQFDGLNFSPGNELSAVARDHSFFIGGMNRTSILLSSVDMRALPLLLVALSSLMPNHPSLIQTRSLISLLCSPIPPVNTGIPGRQGCWPSPRLLAPR